MNPLLVYLLALAAGALLAAAALERTLVALDRDLSTWRRWQAEGKANIKTGGPGGLHLRVLDPRGPVLLISLDGGATWRPARPDELKTLQRCGLVPKR